MRICCNFVGLCESLRLRVIILEWKNSDWVITFECTSGDEIGYVFEEKFENLSKFYPYLDFLLKRIQLELESGGEERKSVERKLTVIWSCSYKKCGYSYLIFSFWRYFLEATAIVTGRGEIDTSKSSEFFQPKKNHQWIKAGSKKLSLFNDRYCGSLNGTGKIIKTYALKCEKRADSDVKVESIVGLYVSEKYHKTLRIADGDVKRGDEACENLVK